MVFAVIDLGTNTFNMLIAERCANGTFKKITNTKISVKLGEATINSGYIAETPFKRGIDALKEFQRYLTEHNIKHIYAYATSAIRSATNGQDFVKQAMDIAGISVSVIDGNEEADLIYYGNRMAVKMSESISLIMDIGGGSTEFILADKNSILWKKSFSLGAARLFDYFKLSDPVTSDEVIKFNAYLKEQLVPLFEAADEFKPVELIGSSGAFDSIVDVIAGELDTEELHDSKTEYDINYHHYVFISYLLKQSTLQERYHIKGMIDMRVDMIVISILLIDFVLNELKITKIRMSAFSLKEGVISKKLGLSLS